MIQYTEKGALLHEAISEAGLSLYELDGVWTTDHDPITVQAFIDNWTPPKDRLLKEVNDHCDKLLFMISEEYPRREILSWSRQEDEARAGGGPLIAALALNRGLTEQEMIDRILIKADAYAQAIGRIIGVRQALEDQIDAGAFSVEWPEDLR